MHWNVYTTDAQNLPPHVSAFRGCHHQGIFAVFKVVLLKRSVVCSTVTHVHIVKISVRTQEEPPIKCKKCLKTVARIFLVTGGTTIFAR
jgi:hypothetical protein